MTPGEDFLARLLDPAPAPPVIAEIKRTDPAGRDLTAGRAPVEIAADYARRGARCLSVVTGRWFGGTTALLADVAQQAPGLPILRKDFITTERALAESRALGASAVLLTARLLPGARLARMVEAAHAAGLAPFIEIAAEADLAQVPADMPGILAVNNSDIATREVEGEGAARSLRLLRACAALRPAALVSASRIADADDAAALIAAGFDALLIGTALMRDPDLLTRIGAACTTAQPAHSPTPHLTIGAPSC